VERERLASAVWAEARYNCPAWDRVRADWDSGFAAVLEVAAVRQSDFSYYRRLRRFVALLRDAHAAIVPPAGIAGRLARPPLALRSVDRDRKSTRLNSSHDQISYAVFCLKKKTSSSQAMD